MPYFPCANQYACATQPNVSSSRSEGSLMTKWVVQRPGYGSVFAATRPDSRGAGRPSVSTKWSPGSSALLFTLMNDTQAKRCRFQ